MHDVQVMKDFFLLARGELFLAFIDLAHHFMAAPPTATTQHGTYVLLVPPTATTELYLLSGNPGLSLCVCVLCVCVRACVWCACVCVVCVCVCVCVRIDVNLAFHQAMTRVGLDVERMGKQFELTVPYCKPRDKERTREKTREKTKDRKESSSTPTASAWDQLSLIHTVQWPLHTLFTPPILNKSVWCNSKSSCRHAFIHTFFSSTLCCPTC